MARVQADSLDDKPQDDSRSDKRKEVDQTVAGAFSPETPSPDRTNPACEEGTPPPWTKQGGGS